MPIRIGRPAPDFAAEAYVPGQPEPYTIGLEHFVIDPDGIVRHASVGDQNVGRSPAETLRVLQALRTGSLCPVDWRKGQPTLKAA